MANVMIVIDSYRVSGPAKGLLDFCQSARGSLEPLVVVFQRARPEATEFRADCERRGLPLKVLWERRRYDLSLLRQAFTVTESFRPDLVQTHGYKADVIGIAIRRRFGIPWIAFSHGWTKEGALMRLYRLLDRVIIRRADRIVAVSEARKTALVKGGCPSELILTIHNAVGTPPVEPVDVAAVRRELGLDEHRPLVAVVGRLSPEKGQAYFLDAMVEVTRAFPGVQGLIVGEGPDDRRLRAKAVSRHLSNVVHFAGYRRDLHRIYPAIDLLVLPSLSEGLPNVALEAMVYGRPIIGTRVGGIPEAVSDGLCGLVVPPANVPALAEAIMRLLFDPALRGAMGEAARQRVQRRFSVPVRTKRILSMYADVLQDCADRSQRPPGRSSPRPHPKVR